MGLCALGDVPRLLTAWDITRQGCCQASKLLWSQHSGARGLRGT